MSRILLLVVSLTLLVLSVPVLSDECAPPPIASIAEFFRSITGDWIGICKQCTDNDPADDKYFHAVIKESKPGLFEAHFDYYRADSKGAPLHIGSSKVTTTITATGAVGRVVGNGEVLVDRKTKRQEHDLTETLTATPAGVVTAKGSGSLKVSGMPLGLGKLGKVKDDQSSWSLANGTLTVRQSMNIVFRALFVSKSFKIDASYTAVRGSDVSSLLAKQANAGQKSGG